MLSFARWAQQKNLKTISTQINIFQNNLNFLNLEIFFRNSNFWKYFFEILIFENLCSKNISKIKKAWLFFKILIWGEIVLSVFLCLPSTTPPQLSLFQNSHFGKCELSKIFPSSKTFDYFRKYESEGKLS